MNRTVDKFKLPSFSPFNAFRNFFNSLLMILILFKSTLISKTTFTFFCLFTLLFLSCNQDKKKTIDKEKPKYKTTDSSVLFFKNLRQSYYDKTEHKAGKIDQYRITERVQNEQKPLVNLCILHNWLQDEAYILLEPNSFLEEEQGLSVTWLDEISQESGSYYYTQGNRDDQFRFATEIYQSILKDHQLKITVNREKHDFLKNAEEREAFRKTMLDFYRLVNVIR